MATELPVRPERCSPERVQQVSLQSHNWFHGTGPVGRKAIPSKTSKGNFSTSWVHGEDQCTSTLLLFPEATSAVSTALTQSQEHMEETARPVGAVDTVLVPSGNRSSVEVHRSSHILTQSQGQKQCLEVPRPSHILCFV